MRHRPRGLALAESSPARGDRVIVQDGNRRGLGRIHATWIASDGVQVGEVDAPGMYRFLTRSLTRGSRWNVSILVVNDTPRRMFTVVASDVDDALSEALRAMWPGGYRVDGPDADGIMQAEVPVHSLGGIDMAIVCFSSHATPSR